jgi:hypothetical protein
MIVWRIIIVLLPGYHLSVTLGRRGDDPNPTATRMGGDAGKVVLIQYLRMNFRRIPPVAPKIREKMAAVKSL